MGVAAKSNVEKRQVGCVITLADDIVAEGYNTESVHAEAMALEILVAEGKVHGTDYHKCVVHVTHQPCPECSKLILNHAITEVKVVEAFMKFDGDKIRYDLVDCDFGEKLILANPGDSDIPLVLFGIERHLRCGVREGDVIGTYRIIEAMKAKGFGTYTLFTEIAEVLTFGARKYKPNNWRNCDDYGRYLAAAWRHWFALSNGEDLDSESGLTHRAHFMTNIMFLHTKLEQIRK